ncbi:MAG: ABC transporter permease [Bacteroidetes bacterium]|nr:ABC transporter permease [Bacteroidota bacterium]
MAALFFHTLAAEWLKLRRSPALWLTIAGALFIPVIKLIEAFVQSKNFAAHTHSAQFWQGYSENCWQFMNMFLLPLGIIFIISMLFQTEHGNGGWRLMHWQPVPLLMLFTGKLLVVLFLAALFWLVFTAGIWLSAVLPVGIIEDAIVPEDSLFTARYVARSGKLMLAALPVISLQFVLSMLLRNFLVPAGIGIALFVSALIALQWEYGAFLPYTWPALEFVQEQVSAGKYFHLHALPYLFSAGFLLGGFAWYKWKAIKD